MRKYDICRGLLAMAIPVLLAGGSLPADAMELKDVRTIEVQQFHDTFALEEEHVRPEIYTQTRTALEHEDRLTFDSPADAKLYLSCTGLDCARIKATLREGIDPTNPIIWESEFKNYTFFFFDRFWSVEKQSFRVAKTIARKLADDYTAARAGDD